MAETQDFSYEAETTEPLSTEVVAAIAQAHDEDIIDQKWRISDDINTDALNGLFSGPESRHDSPVRRGHDDSYYHSEQERKPNHQN